tara:strand:+ start:386 stop:568 length:183 start_codon:yes stop_codon:yes gene_type:complete
MSKAKQKRVGHKITSQEEYDQMAQLLVNHCGEANYCPESITNLVLDQLVEWTDSQKRKSS